MGFNIDNSYYNTKSVIIQLFVDKSMFAARRYGNVSKKHDWIFPSLDEGDK